jgi:hypothetical protein
MSNAPGAEKVSGRALEMDALARQINEEIRNIVRSLPGTKESEELTFYCECGCLNQVLLSLAAYDSSGGAVLQSHSRPQGAS